MVMFSRKIAIITFECNQVCHQKELNVNEVSAYGAPLYLLLLVVCIGRKSIGKRRDTPEEALGER